MPWAFGSVMLAINRLALLMPLIRCIKVLDMALELLLRRWRHRGIPLSSTMSLYRLYERELRLESSFRIWWDMWCLFDGAARVAFLQGVFSLVDPDFAWDMLGVW